MTSSANICLFFCVSAYLQLDLSRLQNNNAQLIRLTTKLQMNKPEQAVLYICSTCRYSEQEKDFENLTGGEHLYQHVIALAPEILAEDRYQNAYTIKQIACLMGCERHCNVHFRSPSKISYVAGKFEPTQQSAQAILEHFAKYMDQADGQVPFRQWPQGMKGGHFVARIPAFTDDY